MNTLIIDKENQKIELKGAKIYTSEHTVPLKLIDLLILTQNTAITPKTIIELTNENVPLLFLSNDSKKFALTLPAIAKNADLKVLQYKALSKNTAIAKTLLYEKFTTHKSSLETYDVHINIDEELEALSNAQTIECMMGVEGSFARKYFAHYFALFERKLTKGYRSKNPPLDPINAMLSYIYTLGYNTITAKLYMRGFDPSISYLHTPFRSHFALSSDMLEVFRADINNFVADLFLNKTLSTDDFTNKGGVYLTTESRRKLWSHLIPFMNELNKKSNKRIALLKKELEPSTILS